MHMSIKIRHTLYRLSREAGSRLPHGHLPLCEKAQPLCRVRWRVRRGFPVLLRGGHLFTSSEALLLKPTAPLPSVPPSRVHPPCCASGRLARRISCPHSWISSAASSVTGPVPATFWPQSRRMG